MTEEETQKEIKRYQEQNENLRTILIVLITLMGIGIFILGMFMCLF